jgi:cellulose synthase/poly-beta-1,6-N-acetylglucosamine synthase-like glycosyltransferase
MKEFLLNAALRAESKIVAGTALIFGIMLFLAPKPALFLVGMLFILTMALVTSRIVCALMKSVAPKRDSRLGKDDFVSIHIATYSEPPDVVNRTLDSLADLEHENYEVIVLDNNTPDPALYEPVRSHCERLGARFRFYHFDNVKGAKAGALNISLDLADERTDVILILDADYQAKSGILKKGLSYFVDSTVGLVQFPQAYRNSRDTCGLTWEYRQFFDTYMKLANRCNTVLSTGTAAFVRKNPLIESGGWSGDTLTEDAELGVRLHKSGYRAVYVPEVVAAGLMPTDLKSLKAQRRRWVLGNAQSLGALLRTDAVSFPRKMMMALQLTAWANPLLFPSVTLALGGFFHLLFGQAEALAVVVLSALSIGGYFLGTLVYILISVLQEGGPLLAALEAFGVHLGMVWVGAVSWCEVFVESDKRFVRTSKFVKAPKAWTLAISVLLSFLCGGFCLGILWLGGPAPVAVGAGVVSVLLCGTGILRWNLRRIRKRTIALKRS